MRNALQSQLDQQLGVGTRDQRRERHLETQPVELALAENVGQRLTREAALQQRSIGRGLRFPQHLLGMRQQIRARNAQHLLQQHLHFDACAAGIQPERGFQCRFIASQEELDGVRHELAWAGCCSKKKSNLAPLIFCLVGGISG